MFLLNNCLINIYPLNPTINIYVLKPLINIYPLIMFSI